MISFSYPALIDSLWPGTLRVLILIYLSFAARVHLELFGGKHRRHKEDFHFSLMQKN